MSDTRKIASQSRTIVDYNSVIANIHDYGIYCINSGVMQILRQLVGTRGLFKSTYTLGNVDDNTYIVPDDEQFQAVSRIIAEFLGEKDMSCNILAGLDNIADKIAQLSTGGNCGVSQIGGRYGSQSPLSNPTSFGGDGEFSSQEAFNAQKCFVATTIVNALFSDIQVIGSVASFQAIVAAGLTVLILSGFLAAPAMPFIIALAATGFVSGSLLAVKAAFDFDALKCALYNSDDAMEAYDALSDMLDDVTLEVYGLEVEASLVKDLILSMANIDVMNGLFFPLTYYDDGLSDCSNCVDGKVFGFLQYGNVSGGQEVTFDAPGTYTLQSEAYVGYHWVAFGLNIDPNTLEWTREGHAVTVNGYSGGGNVGCAHRIANTTVVNYPGLAGCSESGMWVQTSSTRLTGNWSGVTAMTWQQSAPFTVSVTIT